LRVGFTHLPQETFYPCRTLELLLWCFWSALHTVIEMQWFNIFEQIFINTPNGRIMAYVLK
jgi:hypothetical protein